MSRTWRLAEEASRALPNWRLRVRISSSVPRRVPGRRTLHAVWSAPLQKDSAGISVTLLGRERSGPLRGRSAVSPGSACFLGRLQGYRRFVTRTSEGSTCLHATAVLMEVVPVATGAFGVITATTDAGEAGVTCAMNGAETARSQGSGSVAAFGSPDTQGSTRLSAPGTTGVSGSSCGSGARAGGFRTVRTCRCIRTRVAPGARKPSCGSTGRLGVASVSGGCLPVFLGEHGTWGRHGLSGPVHGLGARSSPGPAACGDDCST